MVVRIPGGGISEGELRHWASVAAATGVSVQGRVRRDVLSFLIFARWLLAEAHELGVSVPASEVKLQVEELQAAEAEGANYDKVPREAEFRALLLAHRLSPADRTWLMTLNLLLPKLGPARLARARYEVPRDHVARYYAEHRHAFYLPDQRQLEIIAGLPEDVTQAKREIEEGKPFLEVAQRRSSDPEAPGGLWRLLRGHDEPQVEGPVFAAKPGVLVGPKQYSMFYIFKVLEAIPAHQETLEEAEGAIRQRLAPSPRRLDASVEAEWIARTSCSAGYVVPRCREHRGASTASRSPKSGRARR